MYLFNLALLDLTWREVVADIPVDATAIVLYAVCLLLGVLVWLGSRPKSARILSSASSESREPTPAVTPDEKGRVAPLGSGASASRLEGEKRRRRKSNEITWIIS